MLERTGAGRAERTGADGSGQSGAGRAERAERTGCRMSRGTNHIAPQSIVSKQNQPSQID